MRPGSEATQETPLRQLTDREVEVLHCISLGYSTRQIAEALYVSVKTVEAHRTHLLKKLHLQHTRELLLYGVHWLYRLDQAEGFPEGLPPQP